MLKKYIHELIQFASLKVALSGTLFILSGMTQGVGLVMIIPLLNILGMSGKGSEIDGFTRIVTRCFQLAGLKLELFTLLAAYITIISFFSLLKRYQTVLNAEIQQGFIVYLQNHLYRSLAYADWLFIAQRKSSHLTHALTSDIQQIGAGTMIFLQFLSTLAIIIIHMVLASIISLPLTGIALMFGAVMLGVTRSLNKKAYDTGVSFRTSRQSLYGAVMEHFIGMKTAKSYGVENEHIKRLKFINLNIKTELLRFFRVRAITQMYYEISAVVALSIFLTVAVKVIKIPIPRLLLLVLIFARLTPKFSKLQENYQHIKNMLPSFIGVMQLQEQADLRRDAAKNIKKSLSPVNIKKNIRFQEVWFRYPGNEDNYALENATFELPARKISAVMGPSGAGKSTLADLLLGLLKPEKGKIWVDEMDISGNMLHQWRHSIGYVPQETFMFHDTIRANMLWAKPSAKEEDIWNALRMAAAENFIKEQPKGLDTIIGDRGITLSGGERQRLALARALLRKPQLLLLDEATSALDSENEEYIYQALEELKNKITIVIIAHRQTTLQRADHVILLEDGHVVKTGKWETQFIK